MAVKRSEVPQEKTWRLEDIYETNDAWEAEYALLDKLSTELNEYSGKLGSAAVLKEALDKYFKAELIAERLFTYAKMRLDGDNNDTFYQALISRAEAVSVRFESSASFFAPELLAEDESYLKGLLDDEAFKDYDRYISELIRQKPHTLNASEEKLLAMTGTMGSTASTVYDRLTDADMKFPTIEGEDGQPVEITHANYIPFLFSKKESVRKAAFDGLYSTYKSFSATIPAVYAGSVNADVFYARASKFASALDARLFPDDMPESVYTHLIDTVHKHLPALDRFVALNGKLNGIDHMHMYDVYLPPKFGFDINLPFDEAYEVVVDSLKALGPDYQKVLRRAHDERWIDPFENAGKSSGAYSWGTYDSHPYVLMSYKEDLDHLQTIAHEMGHSMHTYYSNEAQPYSKSGYSLFVAEVASTVNEVLVLYELMDRYPDKDAQAYLLFNLLESYRGTLFRQTMFAEFERESHRMAENDEPLTAQSLNDFYYELNKQYYGAAVEIDPLIAYEWMRIPHFYRSFYVYKYATGFSAAMAIAAMIRAEGEPAVKRYKKFLSAGGSVSPLDALRLAGIDMASPEPVEKALDQFDALLEKYEKVIG